MKFQTAAQPAQGWETLSSTSCYEDPHLAVATVEVRSPAKPKGHRWTVVHRKAAVVIAAMTHDAKLVLIREERIPVQQASWSVPAGQIDEEQGIEEVARRELQEESGYKLGNAGEMLSLGYYFTSPGFTDECCHFVLARPVEPGADGASHHESESILDCRAFDQREIRDMIARNEIRDANTLSICAMLAARGYLSLGQ
ncbi:MAG: NUDIX hydrolase [Chthoniobacterales bacterium]